MFFSSRAASGGCDNYGVLEPGLARQADGCLRRSILSVNVSNCCLIDRQSTQLLRTKPDYPG